MNEEKIRDKDAFWMREALKLAEKVFYTTTPNPRVGCVIVKNNQCIAKGATQPVGGDHAEVCAIKAAKSSDYIEGSTVYVTLEPCSHQGNTLPCVDALLSVRPSRVVVAIGDPNPRVQGRGIDQLRKAGISVTVGVCHDEALEINIGFISRMVRGIPWVWMKTACSLDGRVALCNGESKWITSHDAREDGWHWRARSCVTLTGIGTILRDDPLLNIRGKDKYTKRLPIKAILDPNFQIPESARIIDGNRIILFSGKMDKNKAARMADNNVEVILLPSIESTRIDLSSMMSWFSNHQINEIHVETGPTLGGQLVLGGYIDELIVYLAPMLLGKALPIVKLPVLENLQDAFHFDFFDLVKFKRDLRLRARVLSKWRYLRDAIMSIF